MTPARTRTWSVLSREKDGDGVCGRGRADPATAHVVVVMFSGNSETRSLQDTGFLVYRFSHQT